MIEVATSSCLGMRRRGEDTCCPIRASNHSYRQTSSQYVGQRIERDVDRKPIFDHVPPRAHMQGNVCESS